jgi:hypothetical protein
VQPGFDIGSSPFTLAMWVKTDSNSTIESTYKNGTMFMCGGGGNGKRLTFRFDGSIMKLLYSNWGNDLQFSTTVGTDGGSWVHYAVTHDGAGTIRLYVNGELASTNVGKNGAVPNLAAARLDSEYRPVLGSFVGIDAGDAAYSTEALGDTDIYGTPRILNAALDIGAVEYDWRPTFAHEIGRRFKMTYASPTVTTNAAGGLLLVGGPGLPALPVCVAGTVNEAGSYAFTFELADGSVQVYVGGVLVGEATGTGEQSIRFNVPDATSEIRFTFTPDAENPGAAVLRKFAGARGFSMTIR